MDTPRTRPPSWDPLADRPSEVQVTVIPGEARHVARDLRAGLRSRRPARVVLRLAVGLAVAGAIVGVVVGALSHSAPARRSAATSRLPAAALAAREHPAPPTTASQVQFPAPGATAAQLHARGPAGVAAAFRYPLGCLSVTILSGRPAYATAKLDRASPCWRYGVYVTAIFRRAHGHWRLMLEADSDSCPTVSLPAAVRAQLAVCERPKGGASPRAPRVPERRGAVDRHPVPTLGAGL